MELPKKKLIKKLEKKIPPTTPDAAVLAAQEQQKKVPGRPFQPGHSGNPGGRPPGKKLWSTLVREAMQKLDPESGLTIEQKAIQNIVKMAEKGHTDMLQLIWAYIDGRPNQPMDMNITNYQLSDEERIAMDELLKRNLPPTK